MNHIYRSIWSESLGTWVAVSEHTKSKSKPSNTHSALLATGLLVCSANSWALPTGEQLVAGQVNINTPNTGQMQIDQTSQQAIVNWQGFSIAPNESVNIQQPNPQAALLNRVVGQDASQIQGQLHANGQVYLVNPNGVVFGKNAQVDVGGLVASTHNIRDADFLNGKNHFTQDNAKGTVSNQGNIKTPDGGVVAFIGNQVSNDGTINTPKGTTALAAGKTVDLDFQGNGLVEVKVSEAALNAQINNKGAIQADGGRVVLTAKAAGQLIDTVINQDGIIKAQSLVERNGEIILDGGDNGTVNVSGTLDTSSNQGLNSSNGSNGNSNPGLNASTTGGNIKVTGQQIQIQNTATLNASGNSAGGHITVGNKQTSKQTTIQQGAIINAQVNEQGNAGNIEVLANMTDGTVQLDGELNAAAPKHGNGGFINTSAAHIKMSNKAKTTTLASNGKTGTWQIDPNDYTISAIGGNITGAALSSSLALNNVIISTATQGTAGGNGDIFVNDAVSWSAKLLTLNAERNININANLNGSGTAQLALKYGQASANGGTNDDYFINKGVKVNLAAGQNFSTQKGTNGANQKYTVITSLGTANDTTTTTLQGIKNNVNANYVLGSDINASDTANWITTFGTGFEPIGTLPAELSSGITGGADLVKRFNGQFHGLGHTISSLTINSNKTINDPTSNVGLFGNNGGVLRDIGLINATISCSSGSAGTLAGSNTGNITNAYATGSVTGTDSVGGLVGLNGDSNGRSSSIVNSYASSSVSGKWSVGGLVGFNLNSRFVNSTTIIDNSYATGNVNGSIHVGGLAGVNIGGIISNSHATGNIDGTNFIGGLVGTNLYSGKINDSYAKGKVTASDSIVGGLVGNNDRSSVINNSSAEGVVTGIESVGGLVGLNNDGSIASSHATGSVNGKDYIGGLVGVNTSGSIKDSYETGNVTATGSIVGGLVGSNQFSSRIANAYANGNVKGVDFVGGLVGINQSKSSIINSYETGSVTGVNYVGGLAGKNQSKSSIINSYETGSVTGVNYVGGLVGANIDASITDSYETGSVTGVNYVGTLFGINEGYISNSMANISLDAVNNNTVNISHDAANNIAGLLSSTTSDTQLSFSINDYFASATTTKMSVFDIGDGFGGSDKSSSYNVDKENVKIPSLSIQNSAGRVVRSKLSTNKQFLSLLLEDGSVRVWDFERGTQRNIVGANKNLGLSDVSAVNNDGELISVASPSGIGVYNIIGSLINDKLAVTEPNVNYFANSNDGQLLLVNIDNKYLSLWDNQQHQERWRLPYQRGAVNNLALSDNKHYAAVLSKQQGVYVYQETTGKLKSLTDAIDIIDLNTGKIIKSLPNLGENVIYSHFTDNDTLTLGLESGELSNWSIATGNKKTRVNFPETMISLDHNKGTYAYLTENNTVRIGNEQGDIQLSIQNKNNPITDAELLADGKKLLTVLDSGDLALWDVATGKKTLRLFSTQQGWTVMDAFGRFDGSDEAIENFSWIAEEEKIPLNSFSENYYEPGLLTSVLQNEADPINTDRVQEGINLPPKVDLQLADQQTQGDKVDLKLDVYDRGGGIDKISVFHNGKLLNNESLLATQQTETENKANEHRALTLNISPSAGENTLKVLASNNMGIENSSSEIRFDGKTKAYESAVRILTVGINNYKENQLQLKYSVADAELIDSAIKNSSKIIASKSLTNENATKAKILAELKEISQGTEQDVLVIYFAGHGVAVDKEWYFLPYETKLEPNLKKIVAAGISASDLSEIFKNSKIQHILLMVDSCHSGASMDAFSTLENGQRYFTRQLGHSLGITVITAAAKNQEAAEMKSLGHGLFTYLISQELQKKDNTQPLTAHGIANSIAQTLPAFSQKTIGRSQEPVVYTKGNDFMLSDFLKNKK